MANDLSKNPWYLDTASANYLRSGTTTPANKSALPPSLGGAGINYQRGPMRITSITFSGYTAATDTATFLDTDGNTLFKLQGGGTNEPPVQLIFSKELNIWDLALSQLSSGHVAITFA